MTVRLISPATVGLLGWFAFAGITAVVASPLHAEGGFITADTRGQDRRDDRGDNRDDRQDCRQEEGRVGNDKRDCKQDNRGDDEDNS